MEINYFCENEDELAEAAKSHNELIIQITDVIVGHHSMTIKFRYIEVA